MKNESLIDWTIRNGWHRNGPSIGADASQLDYRWRDVVQVCVCRAIAVASQAEMNGPE
jgi:hypothetical protein